MREMPVWGDSETGRNLDPQLVSRITNRIFDASQICHHPRNSGGKETGLCRDARDVQLTILYRIGFLTDATDDVWSEKRREIKASNENDRL